MLSSLRLISLSACMLVTGPVAAADPGASREALLDGQTFKGQTGEQGKGDHHEDTITFRNGWFRSLDCEEWGFRPARYRAWREGGAVHFSATLESDDRGTLAWRGVISGDTAKGTFRWLHERWYWNIDRHYWFEGVRAAGK